MIQYLGTHAFYGFCVAAFSPCAECTLRNFRLYKQNFWCYFVENTKKLAKSVVSETTWTAIYLAYV